MTNWQLFKSGLRFTDKNQISRREGLRLLTEGHKIKQEIILSKLAEVEKEPEKKQLQVVTALQK